MSKKGKSRTYPEKTRDGELEKLRTANRRLKSDNDKLKSELKVYEQAFNKNIQFLKGKTKDLELHELLEGAKKGKNLVDIEQDKELSFKELTQDWKCFKCNSGVLTLMIYNKVNKKYYFRRCNNSECKHRTEEQPWNDGVKGIK